MNIGLLCSGKLGFNTLVVLVESFTPQFIFTDSNSKEIIDFAENKEIPLFVGNPTKKDPSTFLSEFVTDIVFSINYLFIVNTDVLNHSKLSINLHGSLLPKYRGRTPHVWAIINGENETGVTAHLMEKGCDTGDVVIQRKIKIEQLHTGADILNIFESLYPEIIFEIVEMFFDNKLIYKKQNPLLATYFGKRTPEDGEINWDWNKERINNWVRAQAKPYPGAFTYHYGEKIIIHKISFSELGFDNTMANGLILKTEPKVHIKTSNGVVVLEDYENRQNIVLTENSKFTTL
ncbi:methionyl-tRNA formyltransferase [Carboxylicivirga sp. N1Y90]|uniref:methionyl-tRNA formyltransferase n=1 Tax=Carboxylicivirga fragile TaxID=3417571 RepID=UPI003D3413D9|nr:hypothetical protein [Marinilabiliaceae bacterium N1Y90]